MIFNSILSLWTFSDYRRSTPKIKFRGALCPRDMGGPAPCVSSFQIRAPEDCSFGAIGHDPVSPHRRDAVRFRVSGSRFEAQTETEMLEDAPRNAEILAIAVVVGGVGLAGYSVIRHNFLAMAAGALIAAAALVAPMLLRGPPISVIAVKVVGGEIELVRRDRLYGGSYTARNGRRIDISPERHWGRTASLLINDSDRLIAVTSHLYSKFRFAGGHSAFLSYLLPLEYRAFPRRIAFIGDDVSGPPKTIKSESHSDSILYLSYSHKPYQPTVHGDALKLDSELELRQIMPRVSFKRQTDGAGQ